jgi:hypothetical protein
MDRLRSTLLVLTLLLPALADAQTTPDGVTYSPFLHELLAPRFAAFPYAFGGLAPGGRFADVYRPRYLCSYQTGEVEARCYIPYYAVEDGEPFVADVALRMDRRSGTLRHVEIRPTRMNRRNLPSHDTMLDELIGRWGEPTRSDEAFNQWERGSDRWETSSALLRSAGGTWTLSLRADAVVRLLDAELDAPSRAGSGEERRWYPTWTPLAFRGLRPGDPARSVMAHLGVSRPRSCEAERGVGNESLLKCDLGPVGFRIGGVPFRGEILLDEDEWVRRIALDGAWHATEHAVLREFEAVVRELEGELGDGGTDERRDGAVCVGHERAWDAYPFRISVFCGHSGRGHEYGVFVRLSAQAPFPDMPMR